MGDIKFTSFPSNSIEALAYLYVQNQDLSGKSPEEIQTVYYEAVHRLERDWQEKQHSGYFSGQ